MLHEISQAFKWSPKASQGITRHHKASQGIKMYQKLAQGIKAHHMVRGSMNVQPRPWGVMSL